MVTRFPKRLRNAGPVPNCPIERPERECSSDGALTQSSGRGPDLPGRDVCEIPGRAGPGPLLQRRGSICPLYVRISAAFQDILQGNTDGFQGHGTYLSGDGLDGCGRPGVPGCSWAQPGKSQEAAKQKENSSQYMQDCQQVPPGSGSPPIMHKIQNRFAVE